VCVRVLERERKGERGGVGERVLTAATSREEVCVCVSVCVCEREREREKEREREREKERERERKD